MATQLRFVVTLVRLISPELEAARFGIDELWDGIGTSGPLIEAVNRSVGRELAAFPMPAQAPRRFLVSTEQTVLQTAEDVAALDPTLVVPAVAGRHHREAGRAVRRPRPPWWFIPEPMLRWRRPGGAAPSFSPADGPAYCARCCPRRLRLRYWWLTTSPRIGRSRGRPSRMRGIGSPSP